MQIWLLPLDNMRNGSISPLCAVLVRVIHALSEGGYRHIADALNLSLDAARITHSGSSQDPELAARDIIQNEQIRVTLPNRIRTELKKVEDHFCQGPIEWCFPIEDPALYLRQAVEFCRQLSKEEWLSIYVVSDCDLSQFFPKGRNVTHITETQFQAMNIIPGIPASVGELLGVCHAGSPLPEEPPKKHARSIDEDYQPSW